jgi:hypothetical protein
VSAPFARVLALVEKSGTVVVPTNVVESIATVDARQALHAAGVLTAAAAAPSWPCDVRGCSREVRSNASGARRPLVAVCSQVPAACQPVELGFDDVAQQEIAIDTLVAVVCALLGADVDRASLAKVRARHAIGESCMPVLVATLADCDILWAGMPRDMDLGAFCGRRERVARSTLVLVPTTKYVSTDLAARFAEGEHVEVRALEEMLDVRDGHIALRSGSAVKEAPRVEESEPPPNALGLAAKLGIAKWEDVRILVVDAHTVRLDGSNGRALLTTFVELGLVDGRKVAVVTPVTAWALLRMICTHGKRMPSQYGEHGKKFGVKKVVFGLRAALKGAFGLEEDPFLSYSSNGGWTPRFKVGKRRE